MRGVGEEGTLPGPQQRLANPHRPSCVRSARPQHALRSRAEWLGAGEPRRTRRHSIAPRLRSALSRMLRGDASARLRQSHVCHDRIRGLRRGGAVAGASAVTARAMVRRRVDEHRVVEQLHADAGGLPPALAHLWLPAPRECHLLDAHAAEGGADVDPRRARALCRRRFGCGAAAPAAAPLEGA